MPPSEYGLSPITANVVKSKRQCPGQLSLSPVSGGPFAFAPLERWLPEADRDAARELRTSWTKLGWFRALGLTEQQADRFACRLGVHPAEVWDHW